LDTISYTMRCSAHVLCTCTFNPCQNTKFFPIMPKYQPTMLNIMLAYFGYCIIYHKIRQQPIMLLSAHYAMMQCSWILPKMLKIMLTIRVNSGQWTINTNDNNFYCMCMYIIFRCFSWADLRKTFGGASLIRIACGWCKV